MENQAAKRAPNGIQQHIVHIKTADFWHQLNRFHNKAALKTKKYCTEEWPAPGIQNWKEKAKWQERHNIPD